VDDDAEHVAAVTEYLAGIYAGQNWAIETAMSGQEAVAKAFANRPDVVILDISMPGMSGVEVLKLIRAFDPSIAVIMLTGNDDSRVAGEVLSAGAAAYAPKPLNFQYLDHLIGAALREQKQPKRP
jgi:two-component system OmpR family response regulator